MVKQFLSRDPVARLKQHIPEKFFKMVRYFGFLANRVCGEKLPQVYRALGMDKPEPVGFRYLDHKTGETATETLTQRELVARLKQHIPEKFFKMVRYFGFLANRVCGEKLPQVYRALGMDKPEPVAKVCYAQMVKQFLSRDPFECVLCGSCTVLWGWINRNQWRKCAMHKW